jgi:hypothetical protein
MTQLKKQISPLRQRMIDEINMRKLNPRNQIGYLRAVDKLAKYLKHSPEQATSAQLREFQIALAEQGASNFTMNGTITGLQFLFAKTLDRPEWAKVCEHFNSCGVAGLLLFLLKQPLLEVSPPQEMLRGILQLL